MNEQIKMLRQLGDFERYNNTAALIGFHPIIVIGVSLPTKLLDRYTTSICRDILHQVVNELVVKERSLSAIIVNENELYPSFGQVQQEEFDPSKVVCIEHPNSSPSPSSAEERINNLIKRQTDNPFDLGDKTTPLWRLVLERGNRKDDKGKEDDILAVVISHVIVDGSSGRRLLAQTLEYLEERIDSDSYSLSSSHVKWDNLKMTSMPPPLEELYSVRPGYLLIAKVIFAQMIRPRLPQFLSRWIYGSQSSIHWQGNSARPSAVFKSKFASKMVILPSLYSVAHTNPMAGGQKHVTVQSILQVLCQAAILKAHMKFPNKKYAQQLNDDNGLDMTTGTPVGMDPPNGVLLGNYVSEIARPVRCTSRSKFWDEVSEYYNYVHCNPYQREIALQRIGLLRLVPNGELTKFVLSKFVDRSKESNNGGNGNTSTVVEDMRFAMSLAISNVGILDRSNYKDKNTLLSKCTKPFFGQMATSHYATLLASIISINRLGEISLHLGWRDCVVDDEWIQHYAELLVIGAENLVKSTTNPNIDLTFDELFAS